jgi:hypothetical protein
MLAALSLDRLPAGPLVVLWTASLWLAAGIASCRRIGAHDASPPQDAKPLVRNGARLSAATLVLWRRVLPLAQECPVVSRIIREASRILRENRPSGWRCTPFPVRRGFAKSWEIVDGRRQGDAAQFDPRPVTNRYALFFRPFNGKPRARVAEPEPEFPPPMSWAEEMMTRFRPQQHEFYGVDLDEVTKPEDEEYVPAEWANREYGYES